MSKEEKEKYFDFCNSGVYIPIFSQPWWLDTVCGQKNWDVFVVQNGGKVVAAMPYYRTEYNGGYKITKPKLTQNNGIIISYPCNQKYISKLDYEEKIINEICDRIENLDIKRYEQQFHYSFLNWLPFYWRYYSSLVRYTYVIDDTTDIGNVMENYSTNARNMLKKAHKIVKVIESDDIEEFYRINMLTYQRQNMNIPFSKVLIEKIFCECCKRDSAKMFFAIDELGRTHSVSLLVWDEKSVYYLVNGTDPEYKTSQANTLLIHAGITLAGQLKKSFDFEGSVIPSVEKAFRQFGGIRKPYFRIMKDLGR